MNIFYLDHDPKICATYHNDKHVVKMILEYAQLLCSVHHLCGQTNDKLYRLTHQNHPCAIWVRSSKANYEWLYELFECLCNEYTYRYKKTHLTWVKLGDVLRICPLIDTQPFTPPPAVMPDDFKVGDVVQSYRNYYVHGKADLLKYTKRELPEWVV